MAWCAVINKELCVSKCPIPELSCVYRHRISGECKASEAEGLTYLKLAQVVGVQITDQQCQEIFDKLKTGLINEKA